MPVGYRFGYRQRFYQQPINVNPVNTSFEGRKLPALHKMTEERKFAILFAATILAARRLIDLDTNKPNMAKGFFVDRAFKDVAFILERIDARWPTIVNSFILCERALEATNRGRFGVMLGRIALPWCGSQSGVSCRSRK